MSDLTMRTEKYTIGSRPILRLNMVVVVELDNTVFNRVDGQFC